MWRKQPQSLWGLYPRQRFLHPARFLLRFGQELIPVIRWMPAVQHLARHPVGVIAIFVGALGVVVIYPSEDDQLARGVVAEE